MREQHVHFVICPVNKITECSGVAQAFTVMKLELWTNRN